MYLNKYQTEIFFMSMSVGTLRPSLTPCVVGVVLVVVWTVGHIDRYNYETSTWAGFFLGIDASEVVDWMDSVDSVELAELVVEASTV